MTDVRMSGIGMTSARTRDRLVQRLRDQGISNLMVLDRIRNVPRHIFVDEALGSRAYEDTALPIGFGQTISQPYIVAYMTEALRIEPGDRILEIGTGCGYQTAVLAKLVKEVYTLERIAPLMDKARRNLRELRFYNVRYKHVDGHDGYPEAAPYDGILMAASAAYVPEVLKQQLAVGGRMVLPVGTDEQWLTVIDRDAKGFTEKRCAGVRFVPLLPGLA